MKPRVDAVAANAKSMRVIWFERTLKEPRCEAGAGTMETSVVRIGIAGCGTAARIHLDRLLALEGSTIVGCADPDPAAADGTGRPCSRRSPGWPQAVPAFTDHRELLRRSGPRRTGDFQPPSLALPTAMDALQAGCHVFIEKPLSTNLQEAADIVSLARGARPQGRSRPSISPVPQPDRGPDRIAAGVDRPGATGDVHSRPALVDHARPKKRGPGGSARQLAAGGILADAGDHLIDALLWTTGQVAHEVGAIQSQAEPGIDLVTAAAIRLADGTPVSLAISGISPEAYSHSITSANWAGSMRPTRPWRKNDCDYAAARRCLASSRPDDRRQLRGCS